MKADCCTSHLKSHERVRERPGSLAPDCIATILTYERFSRYQLDAVTEDGRVLLEPEEIVSAEIQEHR